MNHRLLAALLLWLAPSPFAGADSSHAVASPVAVCPQCRAGEELPKASGAGVLVLAHGGSRKWNTAVQEGVAAARLELPVMVAFGMGMHEGEARAFQDAIARLEAQGITRLIVVPLLVSSHSEVYRQYEYLFGLRHDAEWPEAGHPLKYEIPVTMTKALDSDPAVMSAVLLERAQALSRKPKKETVILLAHGPNGDADNAKWLAALQQASDAIRRQAGFARVMPLTIRDDASEAIKAQAREALREAVAKEGRERRVLIVPVLVAQGGIEQKIPQLLAGLTYRFKGMTLLPHPKIAQWISTQALELAEGK